MKHVVSISLGSSQRDHAAEVELMGQRFNVQRRGTNGSMDEMIHFIRNHDGKVDAFGLGGMDIYIEAVNRRYTMREAQKVAAAARQTPIVDGTGLKNTLERRVVQSLAAETEILQGEKKVLVVSAMDRFGLSQSLEEAGCEMYYGDLAFILNLPVLLRSLTTLAGFARVLVPVIRLLPFSMIYPTGKKQETSKTRFPNFFLLADIIAGDFHFIKRYMPPRLPGKTMITNTVTAADIDMLSNCGVKTLVTTTPEIQGRSFGTNVMEALLVAYAGSRRELSSEEYDQLLEKLNIKPRILSLD